MMGDLRETIYGKNRANLDDEHTARTYELYRERSKSINALIQVCVVLGIIGLFVAASSAVVFVVWFWEVML